MQDSLLDVVDRIQKEPKIKVEEVEALLHIDIDEVVSLCKKACLKPKTDNKGNAFFTRKDVDLLKKMNELYKQSQDFKSHLDMAYKNDKELSGKEALNLASSDNKIEYLEKAKNRTKTNTTMMLNPMHPVSQLANKLENLENNLISKMGELLSEKMDGFDEIIVELVRAKTENENLRQQVNSLNKQVFILKNELASYNALPFGLYTKNNIN